MNGDDAAPTDGLNTAAEAVTAADPSAGAVGITGFWRRAAGTAAIVAVLIVGNATQATAVARSAGRPTNPVTSTAAGAAGSAAASAGSSTSAGRALSTAASAGSSIADRRRSAASALHGEFNVLNRDGSAQLRRWQSGQVNAIDTVSVTVQSADGFNSRYLLGPGVSVTGINVGDEVTVVGAGQALPVEA